LPFLCVVTNPITTRVKAPGSSVGIAPGYGLDGPGIESSFNVTVLGSIVNRCVVK
jgi:hypothetical protein